MRSAAVAFSLAALCASSGCSFSSSVPADRHIACGGASSAPCPSGYTCRPAIGECVAVSQLAQAPAGVTNATLTPELGNASTTFALQFEVTAPLAQTPVAYATAFTLGTAAGSVTTYPFTCSACGPSAPCACTFVAASGNLPPDGPLSVAIQLVDALGNQPPPFSAGSIDFDTTPPDITPPSQVTVTAPPGAITPVSSLGPGGSAEVCFTADKSLSVTPSVWAGPNADGGGLAFALEPNSPQSLRYCFGAAMPADAGLPDGLTPVWTSLVDEAGNAATRSLIPDGGITLDTTPPAAPDLTVANGLVYRRAPWGDLGNPAVPTFSLRSLGPAIGESGFLVAYADTLRERQVAILPVSAGALATTPLSPPDLPEVFVDLVDLAGNVAAGGPFLVRNVELVSTLGLKTAGDLQSNPNSCFGRPVAGMALVQDDDAAHEQGAATAPLAGNDGGAQVTGTASWHPRFPNAPDEFSTEPGQAAFVYDTVHASWLGALYNDNVFQTWSYDGVDFGLVPNVQRAPGARTDEALAYDAQRDRAVLYGGAYAGTVYCDTWEWDDFNWTRIDDCLAGSLADGGQGEAGPGPRADVALAYDPVRRRTILVGGQRPDSSVPPDEWEWDGTHWVELPTEGSATPPPARSQASMAFASFGDGGGVLVLGGGTPPAASPADDVYVSGTWVGTWTGTAYSWAAFGAAASCPNSASPCVAIASNPADGTLLRAFTTLGGTTVLSTWDGANPTGWVTLSQQPHLGALNGLGVGPAFAAPIVAYATSDLTNVAFTAGFFTCGYDGGACSLAHQVEDLPITPRNQSALAADGQGNAVLMGGLSTLSPTTVQDDGDVYDWNGLDWIAAEVGPSLRQAAASTYLASRQSVWLFGGNQLGDLSDALDDLWSETGGAWSELSAIPAPPGFGTPIGVNLPDAGDGVGEAFLILDGNGIQGLILLVTLDDGGVEARDGGTGIQDGIVSADYDARRGVLVATDAQSGGLIEWGPEEASWRPVWSDPDTQALIFFDPVRGDSLVADTRDPTLISIAEWDGHSYRQLPLSTPHRLGGPAELFGPANTFDTARERVLLFGGVDTNDMALSTTWELRLAENRPAETCLFPVGAAREDRDVQVESVAIDAVAGASVLLPDGTTQPSDAVLQVWRGATWSEAARCAGATCTAATPGALHYEVDDPLAAGRLVADLNTVGVQVVSGEPNGVGFAQVAVPALQTTLSLRLP